MGEVIGFRPKEHVRGAPGENGAAQILFFTGVRYQREDSCAPAPAPISPDPERRRGGGKIGGGRPRRRG